MIAAMGNAVLLPRFVEDKNHMLHYFQGKSSSNMGSLADVFFTLEEGEMSSLTKESNLYCAIGYKHEDTVTVLSNN